MDWDLVTIFVFVLLLVAMRMYSRRGSAGGGPALEGALRTAELLEERVEALERVLDADLPGWRSRARG